VLEVPKLADVVSPLKLALSNVDQSSSANDLKHVGKVTTLTDSHCLELISLAKEYYYVI
jgi:hypothetical protein